MHTVLIMLFVAFGNVHLPAMFTQETGIGRILERLTHQIGLSVSYLLTPYSTVLLEKLTGSQLVNKLPAFYGTRRFITAFTNARHLSLSRASSIQSIPLHPTPGRSILMLSSHLRLVLPSVIFLSFYYYYYYYYYYSLHAAQPLLRI
jgi:hypothetical protein